MATKKRTPVAPAASEQALPQTARAVIQLAEIAPDALNHINVTTVPDEAIGLFRTACQKHLQTGVDLGFYALQLKGLVGHGQFQDVVAEMGISWRSIQQYIRVATTVIELVKCATVSHLGSDSHSETNSGADIGAPVGRADVAVSSLLALSKSKQIALATLNPNKLRSLSGAEWERLEQGTKKDAELFVKERKNGTKVAEMLSELQAENHQLRTQVDVLSKYEKAPPSNRHKYFNAKAAMTEQDARKNVHEWLHAYYDLLSERKLGSEGDVNFVNMMRCFITGLGTSMSHYVEAYNAVTQQLVEMGYKPEDMYLAPETIDDETAAEFLQHYSQWIKSDVLNKVAKGIKGIDHLPRVDTDIRNIFIAKRAKGDA